MGYPEPNFGIKDRKLGIKDLEGVRKKNTKIMLKMVLNVLRGRAVCCGRYFFACGAIFLVRSMELKDLEEN